MAAIPSIFVRDPVGNLPDLTDIRTQLPADKVLKMLRFSQTIFVSCALVPAVAGLTLGALVTTVNPINGLVILVMTVFEFVILHDEVQYLHNRKVLNLEVSEITIECPQNSEKKNVSIEEARDQLQDAESQQFLSLPDRLNAAWAQHWNYNLWVVDKIYGGVQNIYARCVLPRLSPSQNQERI